MAMDIKKPNVFFLVFIFTCFPLFSSSAFEHENLPVKFLSYTPASFELAKRQKKPIFILISAEWCHWCKVFSEKSLVKKHVYTFLNEHFVNIFVDADIRRDIYVKFHADGLPYIVLMKPDGTVFYKYSGTLYADDFLDFLKEIYSDVKNTDNKSGRIEDPLKESKLYSPPDKIQRENIKLLQNRFIETVLNNFDEEEFGIGSGIKYLMPQTFLYILEKEKVSRDKSAFHYVKGTMEKAIQNIYDPVDGGFFRYAETRRWGTPHYEKMIDVNAAATLLLLKTNEIEQSKMIQDAAARTISYLSSKLFDPSLNTFLSFQVADVSYYTLSREDRSLIPGPPLVKKVFADRLSKALIYLLESLKYLKDPSFEKKVKQSLDFLASMVDSSKSAYHFFSVSSNKWFLTDQLPDYVYLSRMFLNASKTFNDPEYLSLSKKISGRMIARFYNKNFKIFLEKPPENNKDIEHLLELNGLIALTWLNYPADELEENRLEILDGIMTYFSGIDEIFEERVWEPHQWRFLEKYVPYLLASETYMTLNVK